MEIKQELINAIHHFDVESVKKLLPQIKPGDIKLDEFRILENDPEFMKEYPNGLSPIAYLAMRGAEEQGDEPPLQAESMSPKAAAALEITQLLLNAGMVRNEDLTERMGENVSGSFENTALLYAIANRHQRLAELLITKMQERGLTSALNQGDKIYNNTPLILAIKKRMPAIAIQLIQAGAEVDARRNSENLEKLEDWQERESLLKDQNGGSTALHFACMLRMNEVIEALLAKNANPELRNEFGVLPFEYYQAEVTWEDVCLVRTGSLDSISARGTVVPDYELITAYHSYGFPDDRETIDSDLLEKLKPNTTLGTNFASRAGKTHKNYHDHLRELYAADYSNGVMSAPIPPPEEYKTKKNQADYWMKNSAYEEVRDVVRKQIMNSMIKHYTDIGDPLKLHLINELQTLLSACPSSNFYKDIVKAFREGHPELEQGYTSGFFKGFLGTHKPFSSRATILLDMLSQLDNPKQWEQYTQKISQITPR